MGLKVTSETVNKMNLTIDRNMLEKAEPADLVNLADSLRIKDFKIDDLIKDGGLILKEITDKATEEANKGINIATNTNIISLIPFLKMSNMEIPAAIQLMKENGHYDFYSVEVTFNNFLSKDFYCKSFDFTLEIIDEKQDSRKISIYNFFPQNKYLDILKTEISGSLSAELGLDANLNFKLQSPLANLLGNEPVNASVEGKADIKGTIKTEAKLNLLNINIRKTLVKSSGKNSNKVRWEYNIGCEADKNGDFNSGDFDSIVILKVPNEIRMATIIANLSGEMLHRDMGKDTFIGLFSLGPVEIPLTFSDEDMKEK